MYVRASPLLASLVPPRLVVERPRGCCRHGYVRTAVSRGQGGGQAGVHMDVGAKIKNDVYPHFFIGNGCGFLVWRGDEGLDDTR